VYVHLRMTNVPIIRDAKTPKTMRLVITDLEGVALMSLLEGKKDGLDAREFSGVGARLRVKVIGYEALDEGDEVDDADVVVEIVAVKNVDVSSAVEDTIKLDSFTIDRVKSETGPDLPMPFSEVIMPVE